jgi:hypothetical protein
VLRVSPALLLACLVFVFIVFVFDFFTKTAARAAIRVFTSL